MISKSFHSPPLQYMSNRIAPLQRPAFASRLVATTLAALRHLRRLWLCLLCSFAVPVVTVADEAIPANPPVRYWKGNLHTHTLWSDGNDFPEMVAEWYRTHDYNFLALSDHNVLGQGMRWMPRKAIVERGGQEVIPKYELRFGKAWIERQGAAGTDDETIRLKPLDEFRALLEERGKFIMIQGEEISDSVNGAPLHLNATHLRDLLNPLGGATIQAAMRADLRAAADQAERLGREILVHLNHPNFHYAITAEDIAAVTEEKFFEVYNGHPGVNHLGDDQHPGVERIWDLANTLRLTTWQAAPLFGIATDDSHSYHDGKGSTPGRGWVMVQSRHLTPESLLRSLKRGDFYASSGVELREVSYNDADRRLHVAVREQPGQSYTIEFIGSRFTSATSATSSGSNGQPTRTVAADSLGIILAKHAGASADYTLQGDELYVRAVITSSQPHPNPSLPSQQQQAWTQPVGWTIAP